MASLSHPRLQSVGRIVKTNGTSGEVVASFRDFDPETLSTNEPVFIVFDGIPVPFFIDRIVPRGISRALVRFVDVESMADAEELLGRDLLLDGGEGVSGDFSDDLSLLEGWTLCQGSRPVGIILGIEDIPGNPCLRVASEESSEVLVPFHEDLLEEVDEAARILRMHLPEGLL